MPEIDHNEDTLYSLDVIARIDELRAELEEGDYDADARDELGSELVELEEFARQGEDSAADWQYGETLISDSYFTTYARDLAEDCGMVNADAGWPNNHIDWEAAADELKIDYTPIDFRGVTFWVR